MRRRIPIAAFAVLALSSLCAESLDTLFQSAKNAYIVERDYPKAIKLFQACLDAGADNEKQEECLNYLAESYWANNEVDKAIWTFNKEIRTGKVEEFRSDALFRTAMAHMSKKENTQGMDAYAQLAREYPKGRRAANALLMQANYAILEEANLPKGIKLYEQIALEYRDSEEAKTALQWLPNLRKMTSQDLKKQLKDEKDRQKIAAKANAK